MSYPARERRRAVVALGGNALLRRGEPLEAANQVRAARDAARVLARALLTHQLVVTHGNGPQVGLLALMSDACWEVEPYPLDVLDAETAGQIGYVLEMQLDNCIDHQDTVTLIPGSSSTRRILRSGPRPSSSAPCTHGPKQARSPTGMAARSDPTARAGGGSSPRPSRAGSSSSARSSISSARATSWSGPEAAACRSSRMDRAASAASRP
jgi:hypothetical protein